MPFYRAPLKATIAVALSLVGHANAATNDVPQYKVTKSIALGGGEHWDFLVFDGAGKRVYIAHGDHVTVVDEAKGSVIGQIGPIPGGTHGIAISAATKQGYTDDGKAGTAIAFGLASLKPMKQIKAAPDSDAIIYEPITRDIYVVNGDSGSITVIDPKSDTAIATINVGAGLEAGVADGKGKLFINGVEKHEIIEIDARTNRIVAHWPMPACQRPHGLAIDPSARRLFATCANKTLVVVDADGGANIAAVPIGGFSDGAAFDPARKLIFSSNGDGTLSVIQEKNAQTFDLINTIKTVPGAKTMAIDPDSGRLFLAAADVAKIRPPASAGARPRVTFVPGSLKLLYLDPVN
jgi:YVTN family beta-propeller protein